MIFLAGMFIIFCIPPADAAETGTAILVQTSDIEGYEDRIRGIYGADSETPVYHLYFENSTDAENFLERTGNVIAEEDRMISGNETGEAVTSLTFSPLSRLSDERSAQYDIAVIGGGTSDQSVDQIELTDAEIKGGAREFSVLKENGAGRILSIRTADAEGRSSLSALYGAMMLAAEKNVKTVILPVSEQVIHEHVFLEQAVQELTDAGIAIYESADGLYAKRSGNSEIVTFEASYQSGLIHDEQSDEYIWFPETSAASHRFTYRVSWSLSGMYELNAEDVKIHIPLHILKTRDGNIGDHAEMSVPHEEDATESDLFVYRINGSEIEVYNRKEISSAQEGFFEVSYATNEETFSYKDGDHSESFDTEITVNHDSETETAASSVSSFRIDTSSEILSTLKRYPAVFNEWNDLWMEKPSDSIDEDYLIWEIRSYIRQNSTQPYTLVLADEIASQDTETRILGYRFMNQTGFSSENTVTSQTADQVRTDYVLSAHKRSSSDITIDNHITVTLIPEDGIDESSSAESSAVYTEEKQIFHEPEGSIGSEKYAGETLYNLELLQNGQIDAVDNLDYHIIMEGYPYEWTRNEEDDPLDPDSYGKRNVTYVIDDHELYLDSKDNRLTSDDYSIDSLTYSFQFHDAVFNEQTQTFDESEAEFKPEDEVVFLGLFNEEWKTVANWSIFTDSWQVNESLALRNENRLDFVQECSEIRIETENALYHTKAQFDLSVSLKGTDHVQQLIAGKDRVTLGNTEYFTLLQENAEITSLERTAVNFIRRTFRDSDLKKRVVSTKNDVSAKQYSITWKASLQEFITDTEGERRAYPQSSGVFYDLLPAGCVPDPSSVSVFDSQSELSSDMYEYETTENFRQSGRTLLKVSIHQSADEYNLFYDTLHSWESIRDYGTSILNPIAYETGNEDIADGYADTAEPLSDLNRSYLAGLDEDCAGARFVYTEQPHDIAAITSAIGGLNKKVKGNHVQYSYQDVTGKEEIYSYKLRYETSDSSRAGNMIFFDSLENYETEDHESSQWHGTLQSVDVSQLRQKGIDAKVYISSVEQLDIEAHHDLSDTSIWYPAEEDLSGAKAIAIDMRQAEDGTPYVLGPSQSVSAVLYLKAPSAVISDPLHNKAYNNVWLSSTLHGDFNESEDYLIRQDFTQIELRTKNDVKIRKINEADPSEMIAGISFILEGTSDYGTPVHLEQTTGTDGILIFRNVERGSYELYEAGSHSNWLKDDTVHQVLINESGQVLIDEVICDDEGFTITNTCRIHNDLCIVKKDLNTSSKPVAGALYRLSGTSVYGNETVMYAETDESGNVIFSDIEQGTYELRETEAPEGYLKDQTVYTAVLDEHGVFHIDQCEQNESGAFILYDEPLHEITLMKKSSYDDTPLPMAEFVLKGVADDGTEVFETARSDQRGMIRFTGLHAGTYALLETAAPEGYLRDETVHAVRVNRDGTAEYDGLNLNAQGIPVILNQPARNQTIRIIKKWMDDGSQERPVPLIHLTNTKPVVEPKTVTIDKERWLNEDTGLAWIEEAVFFEENTDLTKEEVLAIENVIRIDDETTDYVMYIWPSEDGYEWWSDADVIELPEDCSGMFASCSQLEQLDLSRFASDNVTDMNGMFSNCFALTELDLSHFNTSNVTDMGYMFHYCRNLTWVNLVGLQTLNVENMNLMFNNCSSLTELDLSSFDTSNVGRMDSMFASCSKLTSIYVSDLWSTESVYSGRDMFKNCRKLPGYDRTKTDVSYAHYGEGGYLTYREYVSQSGSVSSGNLLWSVNAEEIQEYTSVSENFLTSEMSEAERELMLNSIDGYWQVLDENTWAYTFPVVNDQDDFWFYEEDVEGYMSNADIYSPGFVNDGSGTIINFKGVSPETGSLRITKEVMNAGSENRQFFFTVTLHNGSGEPVSGRAVYGDTVFENGEARLMLGAGETVLLTGIPKGWMYLVEEEMSDEYSTVSSGASGVIADDTAEVLFTNTKENVMEDTVNITLKKQLTGRFEHMEEEEFTFHLFLGGLKPQKEYSLSDGQIYFADEGGGADFTYRLKDGESVTLYDLPVGSTYQVCEEAGDYVASYEINAGDDTEQLIGAGRANQLSDRFLSTALETTGTSDVKITFTNYVEYVQNITVRKICTYPAGDEEFAFTAYFSNLNPTDTISSEIGSLKADENGTITKTFYLKDGESMTFRNVPVTSRYVFAEETGKWIGEYQIEDLYGGGNVIRQFGTSGVSETSLATKEETVNQYEDVLITFTNSPEPVSLAVTKETRGNLGSKDEKFKFILTLNENGVLLSEVEYEKTENGVLSSAGSMETDENGRAVFMLRNNETIRFINLEPGTFFTVEEDTDESKGYECRVIHGEEEQPGYFAAGRLSRSDSENAFTFINEKNAVIPTGRNPFFQSTAFFIMMIAAVILHQIS